MEAITSELIRRCETRHLCSTTTQAAAALGAAIDAGLISLDDMLDLVRSLNNANELADAMVMLAATVPAPAEVKTNY
jgi:hypothetical protein